MRKWYPEDWLFRIEVLRVGRNNEATECRMGFEPGDAFECGYECPPGFCSKSMLKVFPVFEAVRSGGDLRNLGGSGPFAMKLACPDGVVLYEVTARPVKREPGRGTIVRSTETASQGTDVRPEADR